MSGIEELAALGAAGAAGGGAASGGAALGSGLAAGTGAGATLGAGGAATGLGSGLATGAGIAGAGTAGGMGALEGGALGAGLIAPSAAYASGLPLQAGMLPALTGSAVPSAGAPSWLKALNVGNSAYKQLARPQGGMMQAPQMQRQPQGAVDPMAMRKASPYGQFVSPYGGPGLLSRMTNGRTA